MLRDCISLAARRSDGRLVEWAGARLRGASCRINRRFDLHFAREMCLTAGMRRLKIAVGEGQQARGANGMGRIGGLPHGIE